MLTVSPRGKNVSGCCGIGNARKRCLKDTQLQSARLRVILGPLAPPGDRAVQEKRARDAKTHIQSFERHSKLHYGRCPFSADDGAETEHRKGPRTVVCKINSRFRRFGCRTGQVTGLGVYYI